MLPPSLQLWAIGVCDLISVTPPDATLSPNSKLDRDSLGKVPGRKNASGTWGGYDWRKAEHTRDELEQWRRDGANIGLRTDHFPALDIDVLDESLADEIEQLAGLFLGVAPVRVGRAPKRLLLYRTSQPFGRVRFWLKDVRAQRTHLIEVLAAGQQVVVEGIHPTTRRAYEWDGLLECGIVEDLPSITLADVNAFGDALAQRCLALGIAVEREGTGDRRKDAATAQDDLLAPSLDALRACVEAIPNTNEHFASRDEYIKVGYAIRAAWADHEEAFGVFAAWATKWEGNAQYPQGNDIDTVREDWRRMRGPYAVGWSWLSELAAKFGHSTAADEFSAIVAEPAAEHVAMPRDYTEHWLADRVYGMAGERLRFAPGTGRWYVWDGRRWEPDAVLAADATINRCLIALAHEIGVRGVSERERAMFGKIADGFLTASRAAHVRTLLQSDPRIAIHTDSLDADPWVLNTPAGIVNLRDGSLSSANPEALCSRVTAVAPAPGAPARWLSFLEEVTQGDRETIAWLQRWCGYALTGSTREQQLTFIWGPGGNGKSVLLNVVAGIMGDYASVATLDAFAASKNDRHSTDLAMLVGARLVASSETQAGRRWDEQRIKSVTGGERITARFMRQDNFTFQPQFKLCVVGNHRPEIRDIDDAMKRRVYLLPFTYKPAAVDPELANALRAEWPQILAWMLEGTREWLSAGLGRSAAIRAASEEYFSDEDRLGAFLAERCELDPNARELTDSLYRAWEAYANEHGDFVGSVKRFSGVMVARGFARWREPGTRRMGFLGLRLRPELDPLTG